MIPQQAPITTDHTFVNLSPPQKTIPLVMNPRKPLLLELLLPGILVTMTRREEFKWAGCGSPRERGVSFEGSR